MPGRLFTAPFINARIFLAAFWLLLGTIKPQLVVIPAIMLLAAGPLALPGMVCRHVLDIGSRDQPYLRLAHLGSITWNLPAKPPSALARRESSPYACST